MQGTLGLIQNESVGTSNQHRHSLALVLYTHNLEHSGATGLLLLDQICRTQLVLGERVDVGDWFTAGGLANELDLVSLDILDGQDVELCEEMEGKVVDGVSEDGFLDEDDVTLGLLDLLANVEEVCALFLQDLVHLAVVVDDDRVLHLVGS